MKIHLEIDYNFQVYFCLPLAILPRAGIMAV